MENTTRSDKPVTREQAEKALSRKLPASASDFYYLFYAGGLQDLEAYLRFHVDPPQADQAIDEIISENNKTLKQSLPYVRSSVSLRLAEGESISMMLPQPAKPFVDAEGRFKPISWWQPQTISNGYFRGENQSYALKIWYDADKSLVYVYQND